MRLLIASDVASAALVLSVPVYEARQHGAESIPESETAAMTEAQEMWTATDEIPAALINPDEDWNQVPVEAVVARVPPLDPRERERLLVEHLPTVRFIARKIHARLPQHVELDDLVSAGMVGLIDAFSKFDHSKQVQFKSYAQFRVRGAILDSLRSLDWSPRELRRKGREIEEAICTLTHRLGRAPGDEEIAAEMKISLSEYQTLLGDLKGLEVGSLHVERTEDSGDEELSYVPGSPEEDPLFLCMKGEMKQRLADAIDDLPERERLVLTLYYFEELTMKEIGLTLGVVESRVSQIHSSAVVRLRAALGALKPQSRKVSRQGGVMAQAGI